MYIQLLLISLEDSYVSNAMKKSDHEKKAWEGRESLFFSWYTASKDVIK